MSPVREANVLTGRDALQHGVAVDGVLLHPALEDAVAHLTLRIRHRVTNRWDRHTHILQPVSTLCHFGLSPLACGGVTFCALSRRRAASRRPPSFRSHSTTA